GPAPGAAARRCGPVSAAGGPTATRRRRRLPAAPRLPTLRRVPRRVASRRRSSRRAAPDGPGRCSRPSPAGSGAADPIATGLVAGRHPPAVRIRVSARAAAVRPSAVRLAGALLALSLLAAGCTGGGSGPEEASSGPAASDAGGASDGGGAEDGQTAAGVPQE